MPAGRPPFCPRERRTSIDFVCDDAFKAALVERARREGKTLSVLIREILAEKMGLAQ